jgi:hypothetical protein
MASNLPVTPPQRQQSSDDTETYTPIEERDEELREDAAQRFAESGESELEFEYDED